MEVSILKSSANMILKSEVLILLPEQHYFFLLITPNALNYPVTAISQDYKAFILSIHVFN